MPRRHKITRRLRQTSSSISVGFDFVGFSVDARWPKQRQAKWVHAQPHEFACSASEEGGKEGCQPVQSVQQLCILRPTSEARGKRRCNAMQNKTRQYSTVCRPTRRSRVTGKCFFSCFLFLVQTAAIQVTGLRQSFCFAAVACVPVMSSRVRETMCQERIRLCSVDTVRCQHHYRHSWRQTLPLSSIGHSKQWTSVIRTARHCARWRARNSAQTLMLSLLWERKPDAHKSKGLSLLGGRGSWAEARVLSLLQGICTSRKNSQARAYCTEDPHSQLCRVWSAFLTLLYSNSHSARSRHSCRSCQRRSSSSSSLVTSVSIFTVVVGLVKIGSLRGVVTGGHQRFRIEGSLRWATSIRVSLTRGSMS